MVTKGENWESLGFFGLFFKLSINKLCEGTVVLVLGYLTQLTRLVGFEYSQTVPCVYYPVRSISQSCIRRHTAVFK